MTWRSGVESRASGPKAKHDFIPSGVVPPYLTDKSIVGALPPEDVNGIPCLGSYGHSWLLQSHLIPQGWLAVVASSGVNAEGNPFAVREHANEAYRGLREIPGPFQRYPIIDMFYARGIGRGTRHRGAAAVIQVKASGSYEVPDLNI